ncbi:Defect at low temperature protein 1 [Meyerozyma sp. JA9]|nr:Defect at low temperature protein 1 [Meyerozyma sp. JA9]
MSRRARFERSSSSTYDSDEPSVPSELSIYSGINPTIIDDPAPNPINYSATYSTYTPNVDSSRFITFDLHRRVFRWIYSISLFILTILLLGLASPTPIDVIAQTSGASSPGIKLFIVIIVCVVFLVVGMVMYFSRIFQHRMALNDIPTRSMYIPGDGDLPKSAVDMIDNKLKHCVTVVKVKAGPMYCDSVINHPGLSPPAYVQERNAERFGPTSAGTYFPPDSCYEDVIRSLGDKFRENATLIHRFDYPPNYSMREIFIYLYDQYASDPTVLPEHLPEIDRLINLYERMKFGRQLINEHDLFEFMVEFNKFGTLFHHVNDHNPTHEQEPMSAKNSSFIDIPTSEPNPKHLETYFDGVDSDEDTYSHKVKHYYGSESESVTNGPISKTSSQRSVVRNRLAISSNASLAATRYSGYVTDESSTV